MAGSVARLFALGIFPFVVGYGPGSASVLSPFQAPKPAIVRGVVVAQDSEQPVRAARVTLGALSAGVSIHARSDATGKFEFKTMESGSYRLQADPPLTDARYLSTAGFVTRSGERKTVLNLAAGQIEDGLRITLDRAGAISGQVVDEYGDPAAYVRVTALRRTPNAGYQGTRADGLMMTDDEGRFRLFGLAPGEYIVLARPRVAVDDTGTAAPKFVNTYYPGALNISEAAVIRVDARQVANIDLQLRRGGSVRASGIVIDSRGVPASGVSVAVMSGDSRVGFGGPAASTATDGRFSIAGIGPGSHVIVVRPRNSARSGAISAEYAAVPLSLYEDSKDITITTRPGARVHGRVLLEGGTPEKVPLGVHVTATIADPLVRSALRTGARAVVGEDGTFAIGPLYAPAFIRARTPKGWWLRAVTLDGNDITDIPTAFRGAGENLRVILTNRRASLSGQVVDRNGNTVPAAVVVLMSADKTRWDAQFSTTRKVNASATGSFEIDGLAPGDYLIVATPKDENTSLASAGPETFEAMAAVATAVRITGTDATPLVLKVATPRE
jgi:protocatechuate 3,4-dioxygenase beta subunit